MNLDVNSLAHSVAVVQDRFGYPGLIRKCQDILVSIGLHDANPVHYSKPDCAQLSSTQLSWVFFPSSAKTGLTE